MNGLVDRWMDGALGLMSIPKKMTAKPDPTKENEQIKRQESITLSSRLTFH